MTVESLGAKPQPGSDVPSEEVAVGLQHVVGNRRAGIDYKHRTPGKHGPGAGDGGDTVTAERRGGGVADGDREREQRCQLVDLARDFPQSDNYILTVVGHRAVYRRFDRGGYSHTAQHFRQKVFAPPLFYKAITLKNCDFGSRVALVYDEII